jgi:hypothetical protein
MLTFGLLVMGAHASASPQATIFSPEKGVISDRRAGYCVDGTGISATWTAQHLGQKAAQDLASMLTESKSLNPMSFTLSNKVHCEIQAQVCTRSKFVDTVEAGTTRTLFGKLPVTAKPSAAISFPAKGVICDSQSGFCVDAMGISVAYTEQYLGKAAAQKYMDMIRPFKPGEFDPTRYVLSNGVDCDSSKRVCMAVRRGTDLEHRYTRHLFGG